MATKGKESPSPKEKRVTSPPYAGRSRSAPTNTFQQRKISSPNTSKHTSPLKRNDSSTATEKHIPNYLKPTISSGLDLSIHNHLKKNALIITDTKSKITRRKSFDKPLLPASPAHKTRTSPTPKERTIRSSSFTTRPSSTISHKSLPATVKKTNTNIKKKDKDKEKEIIATKIQIISNNNDIDEQPNYQAENVVDPEEEVLNVVNDNEMPAEVLVMEDDGSIMMNIPQYEEGSLEFEEDILEESLTKGPEETVASDEITKLEEILEVNGEISESHSELEENINKKIDNNESFLSEAKVEDEEIEKVKPNEEHNRAEEDVESVIEDGQLHETKEEEDEEEIIIIQEEKTDEEMKQQVIIQGKNDFTVSNDVIEETANKLREQKKNKVKALAGAFETVISLQEP